MADPDKREAVTDLIPSMPWIKQAPVFLLFCGDALRIERICEHRGTTFAHEPIDAFLNAAADAAIVMQNFIVAAEGAGTWLLSDQRSPRSDRRYCRYR